MTAHTRGAPAVGAPANDVAIGAVSGLVSVLVFTVVHEILISDIWSTFIPMAVVGVLVGALLGRIASRVGWSNRTWAALNVAYLLSLAALGALSVLFFEPMATFTELAAADGPPPPELVNSALPLTIAVTVATTLAVSRWVAGGAQLGVIAATTTVVMLGLGMNISIIGLVEFDGSAEVGVALSFFAYVALIVGVFALSHVAIRRLPPFRP